MSDKEEHNRNGEHVELMALVDHLRGVISSQDRDFKRRLTEVIAGGYVASGDGFVECPSDYAEVVNDFADAVFEERIKREGND